jgi:hypothetical protein
MLAIRKGAWKYCVAVLAIVASASVLSTSQYTAVESVFTSSPQQNELDAPRYEWRDAPSLLIARSSPAVVLLGDGTILVAGGLTVAGPTDSTEILDLAAGKWTFGPTMTTKRVGHTATLLKDGTVLIAGGDTDTGATSSAEILSMKSFTSLAIPAEMTFKRSGHAAVLLENGKVLITGGTDWVTGIWFQAELFDPVQVKWSPAGGMSAARVSLSLHLLAGESALAVGGDIGATSEKYDPSSNTWSGVSKMMAKRYSSGAVMLKDGKVLVAGGSADGLPVRSSEEYNPATNSWVSAGEMTTPRASFSLTRLGNGAVLAAGSYSSAGTTTSSEIFYPSNSTWIPAQSMKVSRGAHGYAVLAAGGETLVIGGRSGSSLTGSVEIFSATPIEKPKYCQPIDLIPLVLAASGDLPGLSERGLIAKLYAAQSQYDQGDMRECLNIMNAFYNQLRAFAQSGHLSHAHAVAIYDGYASVVKCIGGNPQQPTPEMTS